MAKVIYLTKDSGVDRVTELVKEAEGPRVVLVVPSGTAAFSNEKKVGQVKSALDALDKEVVLATQDEAIHFLAHNTGFKLVREKYLSRFLAPLVRRKRRKLFGAIALVLIIVIVFVTLTAILLPEATITVRLRTEPVTRDLEVRVETSLSEADIAAPAIPGQIIEQELEDRATFGATGTRNVGKIASGFIQVFNFSTTTFILRQETTTVSINGKNYTFAQELSRIRPTARIGLGGDEIDPSSLVAPVPVVASSPGTQFNLTAGTRVEIFNEVLGARPIELYAEVVDGISGGTDEVLPVVTEGDVASAFDQLGEQLIQRAREELFAENNDLRLLDAAVSSEIVEQESFNQAGEEVQEFDVRVKARIKALVFDESEVRNLIRARITRLLPGNKVLRAGDEGILDSQFVITNLDQGQGVLATHFESEIVFQINEDEIIALLPGKSAAETQELLLSRPEFETIEVEFSPFWVNAAPRFKNKINLEIVN